MTEPVSAFDIIALRPFVPAKDFETSLRFYTDLGFTAYPLGDSLAGLRGQLHDAPARKGP